MGYESNLETFIKATHEEFEKFLLDFNTTNETKQWVIIESKEAGTRVASRLVISLYIRGLNRANRGYPASEYFQHKRYEVDFLIQALDLMDVYPVLGYMGVDTYQDTLKLNFWPDWNQEETPPGYLEYLKAMFRELRKRKMIKAFPDWLPEEKKDGGHYNFPAEKRREIVRAYHKAREEGKAPNKQAWAETHGIGNRHTLLEYEREFPDE